VIPSFIPAESLAVPLPEPIFVGVNPYSKKIYIVKATGSNKDCPVFDVFNNGHMMTISDGFGKKKLKNKEELYYRVINEDMAFSMSCYDNFINSDKQIHDLFSITPEFIFKLVRKISECNMRYDHNKKHNYQESDITNAIEYYKGENHDVILNAFENMIKNFNEKLSNHELVSYVSYDSLKNELNSFFFELLYHMAGEPGLHAYEWSGLCLDNAAMNHDFEKAKGMAMCDIWCDQRNVKIYKLWYILKILFFKIYSSHGIYFAEGPTLIKWTVDNLSWLKCCMYFLFKFKNESSLNENVVVFKKKWYAILLIDCISILREYYKNLDDILRQYKNINAKKDINKENIDKLVKNIKKYVKLFSQKNVDYNFDLNKSLLEEINRYSNKLSGLIAALKSAFNGLKAPGLIRKLKNIFNHNEDKLKLIENMMDAIYLLIKEAEIYSTHLVNLNTPLPSYYDASPYSRNFVNNQWPLYPQQPNGLNFPSSQEEYRFPHISDDGYMFPEVL
jgi:hypothetical protein